MRRILFSVPNNARKATAALGFRARSSPLRAVLRPEVTTLGFIQKRFAFRGRIIYYTPRPEIATPYHNIEKALGVTKAEDWYNISYEELKSKADPADLDVVLKAYRKMLAEAIVQFYPRQQLETWRFPHDPEGDPEIPRGLLEEPELRKKFFYFIQDRLKIKTNEDWYKVNAGQIKNVGGKKLLFQFSDTVAKLCMEMLPDYPWIPWKFRMGFWRHPENQRAFFDWYYKEMKWTKMEDWYNMKSEDITKYGGGGLIRQVSGSMVKAMMDIYPEYDWLVWKFEKLRPPVGFWKVQENVKKYVDWLKLELHIHDNEDWYRVTVEEVKKHGGKVILEEYKTLSALLIFVYPEIKWNASRLDAIPVHLAGKSQSFLYEAVKEVLPDQEMHSDYRHLDLRFKDSGMAMQLDIYLPKVKLALDFQAEQHFRFHYLYGMPERLILRDQEKAAACKEAGITLIHIPYWWDRTRPSLKATISKYRPDLIPDPGPGKPIEEEQPLSEARKRYGGVLRALTWTPNVDPTGLYSLLLQRYLKSKHNSHHSWMTEIRDGVRCIFDGKRLISLLGHEIKAPQSFLSKFPPATFDGVLRLKDKPLNETFHALFDQNDVSDATWNNMEFIVFELLETPYVFEDRFKTLKTVVKDTFLTMLEYRKCKSPEHMQEELKKVEEKGGRGLVLRRAGSLYVPKRHESLYKVELYDTMKGKLIKKEKVKGDKVRFTAQMPDKSEISFLAPNYAEKSFAPGRVVSFGVKGLVPWVEENIVFDAVRPDIPFFEIFKTSSLYYLSKGPSDGSFAKCRGCHKRLSRVELRLEVHSISQDQNDSKFSFHVTKRCVNRALRRVSETETNYPPYDGEVYVPASVPVELIPPTDEEMTFRFESEEMQKEYEKRVDAYKQSDEYKALVEALNNRKKGRKKKVVEEDEDEDVEEEEEVEEGDEGNEDELEADAREAAEIAAKSKEAEK